MMLSLAIPSITTSRTFFAISIGANTITTIVRTTTTGVAMTTMNIAMNGPHVQVIKTHSNTFTMIAMATLSILFRLSLISYK